MNRFKQIMLLVFCMILFIIFSEVMIRIGLRNTYKTISGEIKSVSPQIIITEAKTTDINGYVNGKIKNNSEKDIEKINLKLELYSKRDIKLGEQNEEVENIKSGEEKEFEIKYRYSNVDHYIILCQD